MNFFTEKLIMPSGWVSTAQKILHQNGTVMVLGIVKEVNFQQKHITAYIPDDVSLKNIIHIEMGQLKIRLGGRELPYMEPKTY